MIVVLGRTGQVAQELRVAAAEQYAELQCYSRAEADFRDPSALRSLLNSFRRGTCIVNAAAYTQVDRAEQEEAIAEQINAVTPGIIAEVCREKGLSLIHLSTDYVFSGEKQSPCQEHDSPGPLGAYGRTKWHGEQLVREANPETVILRTSWVFSATGKNFVKTMLALGKERNEVSVVADQIGGPTAARDIALTCLELARQLAGQQAEKVPAGIYHYTGAPAVTWYDFAREIFQQAGYSTAVRPISTQDYPTPAQRPRNSVLDCQRIWNECGIRQPDWKQGLSAVLKQLGLSSA